MYDGRVGAALGYLMRLHCEKAGLKAVPEPLIFRWQPGKASTTAIRPPARSSSPRLHASQPRQWAQCNVQAAWLLGEVTGEGRFGELPSRRCRLRAIEATLFMIGYELPTPK